MGGLVNRWNELQMYIIGQIISIFAFVLGFSPFVKWVKKNYPNTKSWVLKTTIIIVFVFGLGLSYFQHISAVREKADIDSRIYNAQSTIRQLNLHVEFLISGEWTSGKGITGRLTNPGNGVRYIDCYFKNDKVPLHTILVDIVKEQSPVHKVKYDAKPTPNSNFYSMTIDDLGSISKVRAIVMPTVPGSETNNGKINIYGCTIRMSANGVNFDSINKFFSPALSMERGKRIELYINKGELLKKNSNKSMQPTANASAD